MLLVRMFMLMLVSVREALWIACYRARFNGMLFAGFMVYLERLMRPCYFRMMQRFPSVNEYLERVDNIDAYETINSGMQT